MKVPYFSGEYLRSKSSEFTKRYNSLGKTPTPIEEIVEFDFGIDIIPVPGLQDGFDVVAFLSKDRKEIRVDEFIYNLRPNRYRFSLAHELGHVVLHENVWREIVFAGVESWKEFVGSVDEKQYSYLEFHANTFAGLVLVPPEQLKASFADCVNKARAAQLDVTDDATRDHIEGYISRQFVVSKDVVHRRIEADHLWA